MIICETGIFYSTARRLSSPDASRYNRERKARSQTPTSSSTSSTSARSPSPTSAQPDKSMYLWRTVT